MMHARTPLTDRLVDGLYTEAMLLADEARSYFEGWGRDERDLLPADVRVLFACESLRVTTRLMHVIAWLLTRRAVAAGEIGAVQAMAPERRLGPIDASDTATVALLPHAARDLVAATCDIHDRVRRLEEGLVAEEAEPSPVRDLFRRLESAF